MNVDLIRDLEKESQTLDRIGDSFGQILHRLNFMVFSFEEELAMVKGRKVGCTHSACTQSNLIFSPLR